MAEFSLVYVTASTQEEARRLANLAVGERLAACANILGAIESVYWWQGELQAGNEHALLLKTRTELVDALAERLRSAHSYECPAIVALPIQGGNPQFLSWIGDETRK